MARIPDRLWAEGPTRATVAREWLRKPVASLKAQQQDIQDALDALFGAY